MPTPVPSNRPRKSSRAASETRISSRVGDVDRRQEASRVQLDASETQPGDDLDRLRKASVVQDRVVHPELRPATPSLLEAVCRWGATTTDAPALAADFVTAASTSMFCTPSSNDGQRGKVALIDPSSSVSLSGFSHSRCFPAASKPSTISR
jgi:hypothetical protein